LAFTGGKGNFQVVAADGIPAGDAGESAGLPFHQCRGGPVAHGAQEGVPVRVPTGGVPVHGIIGIVVPALPVFGLMIEDPVLCFTFGNVQVPLIVGAVVHGVPQAPFHAAVQVDFLGFLGLVGQHQVVNFTVFPNGDEKGHSGGQPVLGAVKNRVAHAVAALVPVQGRFRGQEAGVPGFLAGLLHIVEPAAQVSGDGVVAVAQQPLQLGVPVEAVAAHGVGDHAEKILAAQIVDPGQGGTGGLNDVLLPLVIEVSVLHGDSSLKIYLIVFLNRLRNVYFLITVHDFSGKSNREPEKT